MESRIELQLLSAFVDEALDLSRQLEVQARAEQDARLNAEVRGLRQLRAAVRVHAYRYAAPERLVMRIRESSGLSAGECIRPSGFNWRRWFDWQPMALALGVVGLTLLGLNLAPWHPDTTKA